MEIVENRPGSTLGGITGRGFTPGQSGNPGGRPKGLARRVRELVGDNGEEIAAFMFELMTDVSARNADRIEAAKWLGDRGFGRAIQALDLSVNQITLEDLFRGIATEDLEAMLEIYDRYGVVELVESGEVSRVVNSART
jgi:hypothetical protein